MAQTCVCVSMYKRLGDLPIYLIRKFKTKGGN